MPSPYQAQPAPGPYAPVPTFAPAAPPAPKKRNTGLVVGIIVGVVLLVVCLCAIGGVYVANKLSEAADRANSSTYDPDGSYWDDDEYWDEPTPEPSPSSGRAHVVEYRITGKGNAKINFQTVAGYNTTVSALPWTNRWTSYGLYLRTSVSATVTGQQLTCVILVDDKEVARETAKGTVTCIRDLEV